VKQILFDLPVSAEGSPFIDLPEHTGLEPYIYLRDRLRERGYDIHTPHGRSVRDAERVLFWDVRFSPRAGRLREMARSARQTWRRIRGRDGVRSVYRETLRAGLEDQMALFLGEPPVVHPPNWDRGAHATFPIVFTWNDDWVDGKRYHKFRYPITGHTPPLPDPKFSERKLLVNFSGNKISPHPNELYSARRRAIRFFERNHAEQFALYGPGWDRPVDGEGPYITWRGQVAHKWDVYPTYRFGLCYENMCDEPGWVTEKIFDCLRAGSVPIYWGASNVEQDVDPATFIDRSRLGSDGELARLLLDMSEAEWLRCRRAGRDYLASKKFAAFLPPAFADTIIRALQL